MSDEPREYWVELPLKVSEDEAARQCVHHIILAYTFAMNACCPGHIEISALDMVGNQPTGAEVIRLVNAFLDEFGKIDREFEEEFGEPDELMSIRLIFPGEGNA